MQLGSRELGARLVLLYEQVADRYRVIELASGEWRAVEQQELVSTGYPQPRGRRYLVTALDWVQDQPSWLAEIAIDVLKPSGVAHGAPFAATWLDLMSSVHRS